MNHLQNSHWTHGWRAGSLDLDKEITACHEGEHIMTTIINWLRGNRHAHAQRRALLRELGAYTTTNDLNDIEAVLTRYEDAETREIRQILAVQRNFAVQG
jgi:hypothetical protein